MRRVAFISRAESRDGSQAHTHGAATTVALQEYWMALDAAAAKAAAEQAATAPPKNLSDAKETRP